MKNQMQKPPQEESESSVNKPTPPPLRGISLLDAAEELELICNDIENAEQVDAYLTKSFEAAVDNLSGSVDKRIRYLSYAEGMAKQAKEMRDRWALRARSMERTVEWIKNQTANLMKTYPNHVFRGELGSFKLTKNSIPSLNVDVKTAPRTFDVIESTYGSKLPSEYTTFQQVQVVDKEKLKAHLATGQMVPGAELMQGEHVRITLEKR